MSLPRPPAPTCFGAPFLQALAEGSVLAAAVLAPLYFNPRSARVFEPDKLAWLLLLGLLVAGCGLAWPLIAPLPVHDGWRARLSRPLPVLTLLGPAAALAATVFSVVPGPSLWGSYRRGQGLLAVMGLWLLFAAAYLCLRRDASRRRLWVFLLVPALPVATYSLLQRAGIDSLSWSTFGASAAERAFASLGNPIFLGAWLAVLAPLALALLLEAWPRRGVGQGRLTLGAALCLAACAAGLGATASRGPLLGAAVGLGLAGLLAMGRRWPRMAGTVATLSALAASILLVALLLVGPGPLALGRGRTVEQRLLVWQATADLMAASAPGRWLVGHGLESLPYAVGPHLPERLVQLTPTQFFDRAHSRLWDALASAGLVGLLASLAIPALAMAIGLALLGWGTWRRLLAAGMGGALAAVAVAFLAGKVALGLALAPAGLLLGLMGAAGLSLRRGVATVGKVGIMRVSGEAWLIIGVVGALAAHLVESSVGVPTVASDLVVLLSVALLAAIDRSSTARESDAAWADDAVAAAGPDGLLVGLGLAAILLAPVAIPGPRSALHQPALFLIPLAYLLSAVLLSDAGRRPVTTPEVGRRPRVAKPARAAASWAVAPRSWMPMAAWGLAPAVAVVVGRLLSGRNGAEIAGWGVALLATLLLRALWLAGAHGARPRFGAVTLPLAGLAFLGGLGGWRLALAPLLADSNVRAGQEMAAAGDLAGAADRLARAAALWPNQPTILDLQAGIAQLRMAEGDEMTRARQFDAARAALEAALKLAPSDATGSHLGDLYRDRGDQSTPVGAAAPWWTAARGQYQATLERQPLSPLAWLGLAGAQERLGETAPAAAAYDKAWRLNAGDAAAAAGSLRLALARGDWAGATERLERALGPEGVDPTALTEAVLDQRGFPEPRAASDHAAVLVLAATGDKASAEARLAGLKARAPRDGLLGQVEAWLKR